MTKHISKHGGVTSIATEHFAIIREPHNLSIYNSENSRSRPPTDFESLKLWNVFSQVRTRFLAWLDFLQFRNLYGRILCSWESLIDGFRGFKITKMFGQVKRVWDREVSPADPFILLEPWNPSIDVFELHKVCWSMYVWGSVIVKARIGRGRELNLFDGKGVV